MNYELLEKLFVCTLLFSTKDYLPFFFSCVTPVDISFYFRILMCDFYLIPWPTCKIICYLFTASCSFTFTLVHQQWDRLVFQFCNIFLLGFSCRCTVILEDEQSSFRNCINREVEGISLPGPIFLWLASLYLVDPMQDLIVCVVMTFI